MQRVANVIDNRTQEKLLRKNSTVEFKSQEHECVSLYTFIWRQRVSAHWHSMSAELWKSRRGNIIEAVLGDCSWNLMWINDNTCDSLTTAGWSDGGVVHVSLYFILLFAWVSISNKISGVKGACLELSGCRFDLEEQGSAGKDGLRIHRWSACKQTRADLYCSPGVSTSSVWLRVCTDCVFTDGWNAEWENFPQGFIKKEYLYVYYLLIPT